MKLKLKIIGALRIWIIIYPSITASLFFFGEMLSRFPLYQRTFILTAALVPWMIFVAGPLLDLIIRITKKISRS